MPEEFENEVLFLRLGLLSTLIGHENVAFRKRFATGGIWKRSFVSTVRPTVHTNPPRKRSFSKTLCDRRNLKTQLYFYG